MFPFNSTESMEWETIAVNDEHEESDEAAENVSVVSV